MAMENVELALLFGILCISIVIFEQGLLSSSYHESVPIISYNTAWKICRKSADNEDALISSTETGQKLPVSSHQGMLYCMANDKLLGYHEYREKPLKWYDIEARYCDVSRWCKDGSVKKSFFYWTCNGTESAVVWQRHEYDKCPKPLPTYNSTEAELNCVNGTYARLSRMWICAFNESSVQELAWIDE